MAITSVTNTAVTFTAASGQATASAALDTRSAKALIVIGGWGGGALSGNAYAAISDTAGNTFVPAGRLDNAPAGTEAQSWYCVSPTGNAANVVTITPNVNRTDRAVVQIAVFADGTLSYSASQASPAANTNTLTVSSSAVVTAAAGIVVAAQFKYNTTITTSGIAGDQGGSYTSITLTDTKIASAYKALSAALTDENVTATTTANSYSQLFVLNFAEASVSTPRRRLLSMISALMNSNVAPAPDAGGSLSYSLAYTAPTGVGTIDGFKIYYGTAADSLTYTLTAPSVAEGATTSYTITGLTAGTWYATVSTIVGGIESDPSAVVSFTV